MTRVDKLPRAEQETVISYDSGTGQWHFYSDCPKHIRKWQQMIPEPERQEFYADGTEAVLEGNIVGSVAMRKPVEISEERRQELSERMAKVRVKN